MSSLKKEIPKARDITTDLFRRLRSCQNAGVIVLCQVGDGAGFGNRGWTDAISMQTWPSKKLIITGYEVKATRQDWLRELDKPEKNAAWQEQCHEWYVVAPKGVVKLEELPTGWGLMIPSGADRLRIAARSDCTRNGENVPLDLMAAIFRAAAKERDRLRNAGRNEIRQEERQRVAEEMGRLEHEARKYKSQYRELSDALGSGWDGLDRLKKRAAAVRELERNDRQPRRLVAELREKFQRIAAELEEVERGI